jgi:hypothetical protein
VCSSIWIEAAAADRDSLVTAAKSASHFGLQVDVDHVSRWPWARMGPVRPTVTEDGGCACGMLSDDADWNAEAWAMRTDIIEPLAKTLEVLVTPGVSAHRGGGVVGRRQTAAGVQHHASRPSANHQNDRLGHEEALCRGARQRHNIAINLTTASRCSAAARYRDR